ncbi:uncharacterized protein LODBEIA_P26100 [Lodderomyces beijingensis]|uniref:Uncharacterized protein n=1 Tax=Lodderomyces beijingensis TaxID=1775926 RepID=A0ABP0ZN94_9ASCO
MATHCPTLSQELKENEGSKKTKKKNKGKSGESAREREKTPVDESSASSTISPGSMFGVTLNPINSSTKKIMGDQLPEVHPIKTIIGVSHSQILEADLTDVKIKTILSSTAVSKYAIMGRALTKKYSTELFGNAETKKMFTELCINVALHESYGFKTTTQKYPNLLPLLNQYDELQLENTRTSITVSEKETHSNTLDYSVFAYFGHILIWAISLQRLASVSLLTENCDVDVSPATIKSKIGGLHLWDRIFRELKGMNSKRWKHVLKFRNNFAFEEDQFMLILRFMQIVNVP